MGKGQTTNPVNNMYWSDNILSEFLNEDGFSRMLPYLANVDSQRTSQVLHGLEIYKSQASVGETLLDPISNTLATALTRPLALILNEFGAIPFHDRPNMVFPYYLMNPEQKMFIRKCMEQTGEWRVCNEAIVFHRPRLQLHVDPTTVLTTSCKAIMTTESNHNTNIRLRLCNIVLQRVQCHFQIDAKLQRVVNEYVQNMQVSGEVSSPKPSDNVGETPVQPDNTLKEIP